MIGDGLGLMKNELADSNYSIEKDAQYFYSKGLFIRDKVYSIVLKDGSEKTKFYGLNQRLVPKKCFDILYNVYKTGKPLVMEAEMLQRVIRTLDVSLNKTEKEFIFNYNKRVMVFENDLWVDTVAIDIASLKEQQWDLAPLIRKAQTKMIDMHNKTGLEPFKGTININQVCEGINKDFDDKG